MKRYNLQRPECDGKENGFRIQSTGVPIPPLTQALTGHLTFPSLSFHICKSGDYNGPYLQELLRQLTELAYEVFGRVPEFSRRLCVDVQQDSILKKSEEAVGSVAKTFTDWLPSIQSPLFE